MPIYCHICDDCGELMEEQRPMSRSGELPNCLGCGTPMRRDFAAEPKAAHQFSSYPAASGGAHSWEMADAYKDDKGNWKRKSSDGTVRQLNPPGFDLHPKTGDVLVGNRGDKRRYLQTCGLTDYGA